MTVNLLWCLCTLSKSIDNSLDLEHALAADANKNK